MIRLQILSAAHIFVSSIISASEHSTNHHHHRRHTVDHNATPYRDIFGRIIARHHQIPLRPPRATSSLAGRYEFAEVWKQSGRNIANVW